LIELKKQFDNLLTITDINIDKLELAKYFLIATVASGELYFRSISRSFIDAGEPYSKNAGKFNQTQNIKFDFEIVNAIHGKSVTIGEIISHMLPFNNLEDVNSNISTIIGKDLLSEIKKFNKRTKIFEDYNQAIENFHLHHQIILADVKRLYELRHIFCHEFGTLLSTDLDELYKVFCNAIIFFVVCEWYLNNELYPNSPETSSDMIKRAVDIFEKSEKELEEVIMSIRKSNDSKQNEYFENIITKWKEYREMSSNYSGSLFDFGALQPILQITEKAILTDDFRTNLLRHPIFIDKKK